MANRYVLTAPFLKQLFHHQEDFSAIWTHHLLVAFGFWLKGQQIHLLNPSAMSFSLYTFYQHIVFLFVPTNSPSFISINLQKLHAWGITLALIASVVNYLQSDILCTPLRPYRSHGVRHALFLASLWLCWTKRGRFNLLMCSYRCVWTRRPLIWGTACGNWHGRETCVMFDALEYE